MFCTKCGNEIKEGDLFCTKCGNKIEENKNITDKANNATENIINNKEDRKSKSKKWKIIVPILTILTILIIVGIILYINFNKENKDTSQEMINSEESNEIITQDVLTVISKEKANTYRGFINLCTQYGESIEIPSSLYKENHYCFVVSIRVEPSKIDEIYEELSNNEQVLKVEKGFINPKEIELYTGYEMLVYDLLNDEEERNGFGIYYAMVDINNDGINELALAHGKSEEEATTEFYTYQDDMNAIKIDEVVLGELYKVNNENKLRLLYEGASGDLSVFDISYNNNNFEIKLNTSNTDVTNLGEKIELDNAEETYSYYIGTEDNKSNEILTNNINNELKNEQSRTVTNAQTETKYTDKELSKQIIDSIFVTVTGRYEGAPQYTLYRRGEYYEPAKNEEYHKLGNRDDYHIYPENAYKTGNIFFTIYFDTWVNATQFNEYQANKKNYDMDQTTAMGYKVTVTNNTTGESKDIKMTDIAGNSSDTFEQAGNSYTLVINDKFGNSKTLNFNK